MFSSRYSVNLSLPSEWMEEITQRASQQQLTPEEWLYVEVARLLGKPDPRSVIEIDKRLAALEDQMAALPQIEHQLQMLTALIQNLRSDSPSSIAQSPSPLSSSANDKNDDGDDEYDEPDEILYDFLDR